MISILFVKYLLSEVTMTLYYTPSTSPLIVRYMGHVTYSNPWTHFTRTADEYILYILQSGALYMKEEETFFTLKKGDSFLLDPLIPHSGFKASLCDYYFIHFRCEGLRKIPHLKMPHLTDSLKKIREENQQSSLYDYEAYDNPKSSPLYLPKHFTPTHMAPLFSLLETANSRFYQKHENYRLIATLKIQELLIELSRDFTDTLLAQTEPTPSKSLCRAIEIKDYLDTYYSKKLTSSDLASHFNGNYNYINRLFTRLTGTTIMDYLNAIRIEHAKALIASSSHLSFTDIGYLVGIEDPYYFSKLFKKYAGMTATTYAYSTAYKEYK